ncbi:AAA domain-containing protein [Paenibacillus sp. 1_12]|uniref:AAA family ATPase n=1 Tax=Paenibacillus sp. 1_12 TaxID=1566278 RepID=UPI0008E90D00|nr:AAA family ATPase [Paenibacillus sp. 1_12]SFL00193.1 AAA domain-containing protein [Paenibacillus sp. 1_12]
MSDIILFRGRPGVGKTTISDLLSSQLNIPIIRKDDFYDVVASYNDIHDQRNKVSYGILFRILESNKKMNGRFILDFPFNQEEDVTRFSDWLKEHNYFLKSILCICSNEKIWADRFNKRKVNPMPNQLITDFIELKQYYKDLSIKPLEGELVVDTTDELDSIISNVTKYINQNA